MCTAAPAFTYSPIDSSHQDSFRLLDILPGSFHSPIRCLLRQDFRSTSGRAYEALSYTWGDQKPGRTISLNEMAFSVTENVESALRNLRDRDLPRTIWVDAICIDQAQVDERNHQVGQMQQIYACAERVLIWLGPSDQDSDKAMAFLETLCERVQIVDSGLYEQCTHASSDMHIGALAAARLEALWAQYPDDSWLSVARLLRRPWWQRVWIVQEVASSRKALLCCGRASVPWEYMVLVVQFFGSSTSPRFTFNQELVATGSLDRAWGIVSTSQRFAFSGYSDLINLLHRSRHLSCQDPRDKVFALLGLAQSRNQIVFRADYSKPLPWVYTMAFITSIEARGDLEILTLVDHLAVNFRFPSWVAELDRKVTTWRFNKFQRGFKPYRCPPDSLPTFSEDLQIMNAYGFCVDILEDDHIQQTDQSFQATGPLGIGFNWSWKIDSMVSRVISEGDQWCQNESRRSTRPELRRKVESMLYDVMIAGQLSTRSGWTAHEVQYTDIVETEHGSSLQPPIRQVLSRQAQDQTKQRTIVRSKKGYIGLAPKISTVGDYIFILFGLQEPAILRKKQDGSYLFIGTAYIHGIMNGEALKGLEEGMFTKAQVQLR